MKSLILAALLCTAPVVAQAQAAPAPAAFQTTTLSLAAYGEVRVAPDLATITLGVTVQAPTVDQALGHNREAMARTLASLKARGIADHDIQTSGLSLNPQYAYEQNQPPRLTGYEAVNQVVVTVRDLPRLGAAVDAAVSSGANRIEGISFGLANPDQAENAARRAAVQALSGKAQLYATATGYAIRRLVSLSERGGYTPEPPMPMMAMASAGRMKSATPVAPGELKVRIDISGLYELGR